MGEDWISPWWQALTVPRSWDVCGVSVPALSVWHYFALENIGNAYFRGGDPSADDAASLLLFCSRDMAGGLRLIHGDNYRRRAMVRMARRLRVFTREQLDSACQEYVSTCTRSAHRVPQSGAGGTPAGTPTAWAIVSVLTSGGLAWAEAWDFPYVLARASLDAWDERQANAVMAPWLYGEHMFDNWPEYQKMTGSRSLSLFDPAEN